MYIGVGCARQSTKVAVVLDVEQGLLDPRREDSRPHHLDEGEHGRREQAPSEIGCPTEGAFLKPLERGVVDAGQVRGYRGFCQQTAGWRVRLTVGRVSGQAR